MIQPVNGHLLIEPLKHDSFIASQRDTFQEIGTVVAFDPMLSPQHVFDGDEIHSSPKVEVGMKVYFDSWLAAKYPNGDDGFYWLVQWPDVRAVEYGE